MDIVQTVVFFFLKFQCNFRTDSRFRDVIHFKALLVVSDYFDSLTMVFLRFGWRKLSTRPLCWTWRDELPQGSQSITVCAAGVYIGKPMPMLAPCPPKNSPTRRFIRPFPFLNVRNSTSHSSPNRDTHYCFLLPCSTLYGWPPYTHSTCACKACGVHRRRRGWPGLNEWMGALLTINGLGTLVYGWQRRPSVYDLAPCAPFTDFPSVSIFDLKRSRLCCLIRTRRVLLTANVACIDEDKARPRKHSPNGSNEPYEAFDDLDDFLSIIDSARCF